MYRGILMGFCAYTKCHPLPCRSKKCMARFPSKNDRKYRAFACPYGETNGLIFLINDIYCAYIEMYSLE